MNEWNMNGLVLAQDNNAPAPATPAPNAAPAPANAGTPAANSAAPAASQVDTGRADGSLQQPQGGAPAPGMEGLLLPFILLAVMLIFFMILPARARKKQQKKFDEMMNALKRDDRVMLQNGKFVTIDRVENDRIFVFADKNRSVLEEYHKNAVSMRADEVDKQNVRK
ncbi:MAG: preprotein translocase subunit YajC [Planctomycetes bacterium]|nr:preprotein translocase subunit YajC [Planctomycetota bacterium]